MGGVAWSQKTISNFLIVLLFLGGILRYLTLVLQSQVWRLFEVLTRESRSSKVTIHGVLLHAAIYF